MLQPKRTKYRKAHKGRIHGNAKGGTTLNFGTLWAEGAGTGAADRAADRGGAARHHARDEAHRAGVDPHLPRRAGVGRSRPRCAWDPARVRRNSGCVRVAPGRIMFEIDGVPAELAREALTLGAAKLPIRTRFVARIGDA